MSELLPFKNASLAIVGVGLIGGSLGLAFKRLGIGRQVIGISRQETLKEARSLGAIDSGVPYDQMAPAIREVDVVFLCLPITGILNQLPGVMASARDGCLVTDVGSTKRAIVVAADHCRRKGVFFVGGHPMAGSEQSGVGASDPFLFENALYVLTPAEGVPEDRTLELADLVCRLGARPLRMDARTHDRVAAAVSHLPQMMATSLVGLVGRLSEAEGLPLEMAAGGFRDMTRIASSPFSMWRDICQTNSHFICDMIDAYMEALAQVRERVGNEVLAQDFQYANRVRNTIPKDSKGFLNPLHELLIVVADRPGVIADAASRLASVNINIEDIEVLKVREGEGGTLRMGFNRQPDAVRAVEILAQAGYQVRLR